MTHVTKPKVYCNILVKKLNVGIFTCYLKEVFCNDGGYFAKVLVLTVCHKRLRGDAHLIILLDVGD